MQFLLIIFFVKTGRNVNQTTIHLILIDVNDNAPEMPFKTDYAISEDAIEVR